MPADGDNNRVPWSDANRADDVLTLRHEYIQKVGDKYFVVMANGDKRSIEVGIQNEEAFEILSGVKEGEKVRQTDFFELYSEKQG